MVKIIRFVRQALWSNHFARDVIVIRASVCPMITIVIQINWRKPVNPSLEGFSCAPFAPD